MSLKITKTGLLDTVQDGGRYGYQHLGINPGGVMDRFSASLANALLGKSLHAPVLELHFPAAQILFQQPAVFCLAGADFTPAINGKPVLLHQPLAVKENTLLSFNGWRKGARCYLALLNEWELTPWLNSYSTHLKLAAGGFGGRRLVKDDIIPFAEAPFFTNDKCTTLPWQYKTAEKASTGIQFIPGPEWDWLTVKSQTRFLNGTFTIAPASDRMGYRLQGEALEPAQTEQLISSAVTVGTVQLLPSGQLIVLMADHQTTGGYPRIATIIHTHLPRLAQRHAGDNFQFVMTTVAIAEEKFVAQQKSLASLQNTCKLKLQNWFNAHRHQL